MTDWLIDTLLWTSILMLVVLAIREPVRRQFGAGVAYALWLLPAARIVMPTLTHQVERAAPAADPVALTAAMPTIESAPLIGTQTGHLLAANAAQPTVIETLGGWPTLLLAVWLAGAGALFSNRMIAYRRERARILEEAVPVSTIGRIRLVRSPSVDGPLAFGIVDRVIALPEHFEAHYTPSERRLALEHELAHHRSGDLVANLIAFVLLSLQWFNPLAWASYAAFRFDQEAACDARVLDRADDPSAYGRTIAKAASGRALLFASALDRKSSLKRRLNVMMKTTPKGRRRAGQMMVLGCIAVSLPLTATKAVEYVQTAPSAPVVPAAAMARVAPVAPTAAVAPIAPTAPIIAQDEGDRESNSGSDKPYSQMSAEERASFDEALVEMREALQELRQERVDVRAEIATEMAEARAEIDRTEFEADIAEARRDIAEAKAEIDAERAEIVAEGGDPEAIKASLDAALASIEAMDFEAIVNGAMASVDPEAIQRQVEASMAQAEASIRQSLEKMERQRRQ